MLGKPSQPVQVSNRRGAQRAGMELPVLLHTASQDTVCVASGRTRDISESGMAVATRARFAPDQKVSVELKLPETRKPILLEAVVRHVGRDHYGLLFQGPVRRDLSGFCRQCA